MFGAHDSFKGAGREITTDFGKILLSAGKRGESGPQRFEIDNLGKSVIMESCLIS